MGHWISMTSSTTWHLRVSVRTSRVFFPLIQLPPLTYLLLTACHKSRFRGFHPDSPRLHPHPTKSWGSEQQLSTSIQVSYVQEGFKLQKTLRQGWGGQDTVLGTPVRCWSEVWPLAGLSPAAGVGQMGSRPARPISAKVGWCQETGSSWAFFPKRRGKTSMILKN